MGRPAAFLEVGSHRLLRRGLVSGVSLFQLLFSSANKCVISSCSTTVKTSFLLDLALRCR